MQESTQPVRRTSEEIDQLRMDMTHRISDWEAKLQCLSQTINRRYNFSQTLTDLTAAEAGIRVAKSYLQIAANATDPYDVLSNFMNGSVPEKMARLLSNLKDACKEADALVFSHARRTFPRNSKDPSALNRQRPQI